MEKKMVRLVVISAAVLLLLSLVAIAVVAHPYTVKCPRDGNDMYFDHQVGYGKDAVCWYTHDAYEPGSFQSVKHEAYIQCNDSPYSH